MKAVSLKFLIAILLASNIISPFVRAEDSNASQVAYEAVQTGIQQFQAGNLDAAAEKFEQAITLTADNTVIQFDQACVELAKGQSDNAKEKLRQAVAGTDPEVVQSAHYNLGFLKVQQVKAKLQPDPAAVKKKDRTEIVDQLEQAARLFRNTLEINADHQDAAYNLELIRMYVKQLQTTWKQQDEQQQQPEESLTQLLLRLHTEFRKAETRAVNLEIETASASRQTAILEFQRQLQKIDADVKKVKPLFDQWVQSLNQTPATQNQAQTPPQVSADELAAIESLSQLVDQLEASSETTVAAIATEDWKQGQQSANGSIQAIHQLFLNVASYQETLQAALTRQQQLKSKSLSSLSNQNSERIQEQQFVSDFCQAIKLQAEQQLPQVQQQLEQLKLQRNSLPASEDPSPPSTSQATAPAASVVQNDEQRFILEGLQESMSRATELAPDAILYADKSANLMLKSNQSQKAEPEENQPKVQTLQWAQGKVVSLLQDIIEPLQDPDSDQQQQQSGDQNGDKSEDNEDSPDDENEDDSGEDSADPEQRQPEDSTDEDKQSSKQEPAGQNEEDNQQQMPEMAQQQAEAILRKATEREQEYLELKKQLRKRQSGTAVKKDW